MRYLAVIPAWYAIFSIYEAIALSSYDSGIAVIAGFLLSGAAGGLGTHLRVQQRLKMTGMPKRPLYVSAFVVLMTALVLGLSIFTLSKAEVEFGVIVYILLGVFGFYESKTQADEQIRG